VQLKKNKKNIKKMKKVLGFSFKLLKMSRICFKIFYFLTGFMGRSPNSLTAARLRAAKKTANFG